MDRNTPPAAARRGPETPAVAEIPSVSGSPLPAPSAVTGDRARGGIVVCDDRGIAGVLLRRATTLAIEPAMALLSLRRTESRTVGGGSNPTLSDRRSHPNAGAIALLEEWAAEDREEDTGELEALQRDMDESRSSLRGAPSRGGYPGAVALLRSWTREDRAGKSEDLDDLKRNLDADRPATEKLFS